MANEIKLVPFGKLLNLIESAGYKLEYHYNDLVFINNNSFLFRFDTHDFETVYLHFNKECNLKTSLNELFMKLAIEESVKLELSDEYIIEQVEDSENLKIEFLPAPSIIN